MFHNTSKLVATILIAYNVISSKDKNICTLLNQLVRPVLIFLFPIEYSTDQVPHFFCLP